MVIMHLHCPAIALLSSCSFTACISLVTKWCVLFVPTGAFTYLQTHPKVPHWADLISLPSAFRVSGLFLLQSLTACHWWITTCGVGAGLWWVGGCCAAAHACQPVALSPPRVLSLPRGEAGLRHVRERRAAPSLAVTSAGLRCHGLSLTYVKPSFSQLSPTICQVWLGAHSVRFAMQARWQLENRAVLPA